MGHEELSPVITRRIIEAVAEADHLRGNRTIAVPKEGEMSFQSRRPLSDQDHLSSEAAPPLRGRRFVFMMAIWRERIQARRCLARMDARSLREIGISPIAAAYESGKPFWRKIGPLR